MRVPTWRRPTCPVFRTSPINDESQVFLGGKEVQAKYLGRGHTNGDAVIYFPSEKVLHTGDLFTNGAPYCDTSANCSIKEWDKTLQKAMQYDFDSVIPGHGPVMKKADSPGLSPISLQSARGCRRPAAADRPKMP